MTNDLLYVDDTLPCHNATAVQKQKQQQQQQQQQQNKKCNREKKRGIFSLQLSCGIINNAINFLPYH